MLISNHTKSQHNYSIELFNSTLNQSSAAQKKHIKIRVPVILRWNNASMGGVDTLDKLLSSYRPLLRSIKW
ncbi:hypothetical protein T4B_11513 [Trichinella pseudospiralis]|uniref:PiggyBac transposable element-derived protein domain-containing protein n=2 Tax=Trichinella pseudospiralis TaxID=6337 RepID=A0A0V1IUB9_TRIPS|nr:hypothetical protein T4A_846 [Trichinella pseudospiralis]KRY80490.1 hypothetical protein T4D_10608 [Trichinella pseudospiralis]KRZ13406.1 hypothetical protein T4B_11513 [Trichinella pseudospiralis]KRZ25727.1 hypothetical protein T4C_3301 [Trichinella pseudospiralis]KRZ25765.1 hypothetical protein T4C_7219 [Trichinella pseudospiralis]